MESAGNKGIFINGKGQIIELLQFMSPQEREKLLRNIKSRNPAMAKELIENSLTFDQLHDLSDEELKIVFEQTGAPITGIALQGSPRTFQRRVLSCLKRDFAERAFEIMNKPLPNGEKDIMRAKKKALNIAVSLSKRGLIQL